MKPEPKIVSSQNLTAGNCNPNKRIQAGQVRQLCGDISDMTLWRWLDDNKMDFPQPIYIARRRYWREADVSAWLDAQAEVAV